MDQTKLTLGIELGSTRIKAVLTDEDHLTAADGSFEWENRFENGYWTYDISDAVRGVRECFAILSARFEEKYKEPLTSPGSIGISAMMHGYLPFDSRNELLVPFRTWRNSTTGRAADYLTELFCFNIPQRWSVSHLYDDILSRGKDVNRVAFITTLSGYIHYLLTGEKIIGIGDASGMFPIDPTTLYYDRAMLDKFDSLILEHGINFKIEDILPLPLPAGKCGGHLTKDGALLLDPTGKLMSGIPLCPPEGDGATGLVSTNTLSPGQGNVSAGTSIFSMLVLEKNLLSAYRNIDSVVTPSGLPVAMVHASTCTTDIDSWVKLFSEAYESVGKKLSKTEQYSLFYKKAMEGDADCGGLISYNYCSSEEFVGIDMGLPLFLRPNGSAFSLANFARCHLYSAMSVLRMGMDLLSEKEKIKPYNILAHGGLFKIKGCAQKLLAGALNTPVTVTDTAGEGGAWGMALLAEYMIKKLPGDDLSSYLTCEVFHNSECVTEYPDKSDVAGFEKYFEKYKKYLSVEKTAAEIR